jgi:hypothetical protein
MKSFLWALLLFQAAISIRSFVIPHQGRQYVVYSATSSPEEYTDTEVQEMRDLVLSLSLETDDHERRTRVKDIFHEALARPNGMPKKFTDLFDSSLIKVGEEKQAEAKKKFFEEQKNAKKEEVIAEETDSEEETVPTKRVKSPEELQLWALVDMMVQTKTIVKKASGDLGSKGEFQ